MKRALDWLRLHPWVGTAFFGGALLGIMLCLPMIPFTLPDSHASLIGAALGAFVAVWGAAWVADGKSRRNAAIARKEIENVIRPTIVRFDRLVVELFQSIEAADMPGLELAANRAQAIGYECGTIERWLVDAKPLFNELGAAGMSGYARLTHAVTDAGQFLRGTELDYYFVLQRKDDLKLRRDAIRKAVALIDQ